MAAAGSTQRYKRQLDQLEHSLTAKLQELSILEQENEVLKAQERALSSFISSVEGGVAVTAHMLKKQASTGAAAAAAALEGQAGSTAAAAAAGSSATADAELLQIIESKEREIQLVLQQLEAGPYEELYSTLLLRTAATNAEATAQLLATPPKQRRQNWRDRVQHIALLLPKYEYPELGSFSTAAAAAAASGVSLHTPGSRSSSGSGSSAQVVVDGLVDDLATVLLVTGLLDPPQMTLYNFMVNMSTNMVVDSYPEGFWQHVAQGLQLSDKQRSALHISWNRIKAEKLALTAQHEDVLARLNQIRALLRQQSKQFEEKTHQVMQQPPDPHDEIVQRRQQQQDFFAWQQRQHQQQRRQQQQQCEGVGVQGDSQDPRFTCDHRCDLDCDHRSDLDLDLGHTLDDLDLGVSEIQDLLRDMTNDDDHQHQWLLLQEIEGQQQQQQLDQPSHADHQHQGLATSDVFTLAVTALTHDVTNGLDDSPRQPAAAAVTRQQQQQQQQPNDAPIKLVPQEQQQSKPAQSSSPQQQQQQQQDIPATATAPSTPRKVGSSSSQQQQEQTKPEEDLPLNAQEQQQQQQSNLPSDTQPQQQQQQSSLPSNAQPQQQQQQQVDTSPLLNWQEIATQLQDVQQQLGACTEQQEHFVPVGSKEQQQLERELNRIRGKIKMQHYCSALFWVNTLSKKQLATLYVLSWPFMPDGFALSEQLEADRTPSTSAGTTKSS